MGVPRGDKPKTTLALGPDGAFYGLTLTGGDDEYGVLFKLTNHDNGWNEQVLCNLDEDSAPELESTELAFDASDSIYWAYLGKGGADGGAIYVFTFVRGH